MKIATMATLVAVACGGALLATTAEAGASAATPPQSGTVHIFYTQQGLRANGAVVFTGAIGDYGKAVSTDKNGKPNPNGNYEKVTLRHGTLELNATALDAKFNKTKPTTYPSTCSGQETGTTAVGLLDGTGLYAGVTGTIRVTFTDAFIIPPYTSGKNAGKCNTNAKAPTGLSNLITGSGRLSF